MKTTSRESKDSISSERRMAFGWKPGSKIDNQKQGLCLLKSTLLLRGGFCLVQIAVVKSCTWMQSVYAGVPACVTGVRGIGEGS